MVTNFIVQKTVVRHSDGSYLVLRRSDTDIHKPLEWDLPGGVLSSGETLEYSAMREINEEVGTKIAIIKLVPRYTYSTMTEIHGKKHNYIKIIYAAHATAKEVELSYEHDMFEWVHAAEFTKRFASQPRYHKAVRYILDNKLDQLP